MRRKSVVPIAAWVSATALLGLVGFTVGGNAALAQPNPSLNPGEEITVQGPYYTERRVSLPQGSHGLTNPQFVTLSRTVDYHDLDLSKPAGAIELENRVHQTARDVCRELQRRSPRSLFQVVQNDDCVRTATNGGIMQARRVIAATTQTGMVPASGRPPG